MWASRTRRAMSWEYCEPKSRIAMESMSVRKDNLAIAHIANDCQRFDGHIQAKQGLAPAFERFFDDGADADHPRAGGLCQPGQPHDGLAGGQEVVDDEHALLGAQVLG